VARPPPPPVDWEGFKRAPAASASPSAPTAKESSIAQDYVAALGTPALPRLGPLFDSDAHASFPGMDDAHDREGVVRMHAALFSAFEQRHFVTSRIWRTAGEQTVEWTMSGVQSGDWMGVSATHKPVVVKGVTLLWTNDDGTIADAHVVFDVAAIKAQLGAGPKELAGLAAPAVPSTPPQVFDATPAQPDLVPTVRTALDALENTAEGAYAAQIADDIEVYTAERADPARGKDAQIAYFKTMHKAIAQLDATVDNGWSVATYAIVEYTLAGEQLGPIGWVPLQRDHVVKKHNVDVDEIKDGRIVRVWRYDNPNELLAAGP
jgi:predicted ester cyclase